MGKFRMVAKATGFWLPAKGTGYIEIPYGREGNGLLGYLHNHTEFSHYVMSAGNQLPYVMSYVMSAGSVVSTGYLRS